MSVVPLPLYASTSARKDMTPSQVATLNETISTSLNQCLALPANKFDIPSGVNFVRTYTKDVAARILQNLIWNTSTQDGDQLNLSLVERSIHRRTLLLAERLASSLDFQTIVDLAITYGSSSPRRIRPLFSSAFSENLSLGSQVTSQGLPALTYMLSSTEQGLYGLRKMSYIILSVVRSAPKELLHSFAHNKEIIVALAKAYDHGLFSIAQSYGGFRFAPSGSNIQSYTVEDWERIFLETKVALIDSFHLILRSLLSDIAAISSAGPALAAECEQAFDTIFALLELPSSSQSTPNQPPTPFLNQSLLSDYQHSYDLSRTLSSILKRASDPRTELLESTLRSLDTPSENGSAGALTLIIRSSGIPPGIDHKGKGVSQTYTDKKGKGKATDVEVAQVKTNPALDKAVTQVLDILPEQPPDYIYYLLSHPDYPYKGNPERLVEALLEGTAPAPEEVEHAIAWQSSGGEAGIVSEGGVSVAASIPKDEEFQYTKHRLNVFDDQKMDLSQVRIGKKNDVSSVVIQDRAFIDQMKADILRRAEEASYSDEEDEDEYNPYGGDNRDKSKGKDVAFEDELDEDGRFKVRDGEGSEDDEDGSDSGGEGSDGDAAEGSGPKRPETTLELAYIRDPKLFDRDAQTRRSKARADLKAQTGWSDEQIEGWRIMLERNPKKDKILQKHEFSGNRPGLVEQPSGPSQQPSRGGGRGGRGRGGGGGRGRGRGGRGGHGSEGGTGGGDGGSARDRAWKDKHKSSRGNHNRKSGHDKKMAKAGGPS